MLFYHHLQKMIMPLFVAKDENNKDENNVLKCLCS